MSVRSQKYDLFVELQVSSVSIRTVGIDSILYSDSVFSKFIESIFLLEILVKLIVVLVKSAFIPVK